MKAVSKYYKIVVDGPDLYPDFSLNFSLFIIERQSEILLNYRS